MQIARSEIVQSIAQNFKSMKQGTRTEKTAKVLVLSLSRFFFIISIENTSVEIVACLEEYGWYDISTSIDDIRMQTQEGNRAIVESA